MQKLLIFLFLVLVPFLLLAQADGRDDDPVEVIRQRYNEANLEWRIRAMEFILNNQEGNIEETIQAMDDFTAITRSYIDLNRRGRDIALHLYYINLENIRKLQQLELRLNTRREDFQEFEQGTFMDNYTVQSNDLVSYEPFRERYETIMERWRGEYEAALRGQDADAIQRIRQDMIVLQAAIDAFVLFPGASANRVPNLQQMHRDLRHAVNTLQTHIAAFRRQEEEDEE